MAGGRCTYWFRNPCGPFVISSFVCPPLKPAGTFPCCFCPLCPRPDVLPLPDAGPRPRRIFLLYAPGLSESDERMDAVRCCWAGSRNGASKGTKEGELKSSALQVCSSWRRGGIVCVGIFSAQTLLGCVVVKCGENLGHVLRMARLSESRSNAVTSQISQRSDGITAFVPCISCSASCVLPA